jgi:predicted HicB family RNase H-like nuclease
MTELKHKGRTGRYTWHQVDKCWAGTLSDTDNVVTFEGDTVDEVEKAFRESVEDYLQANV